MANLTMMGGRMVVEPTSDREAKALEAMAYKGTSVDIVDVKAAKRAAKKAEEEKAETKAKKAEESLKTDPASGSDEF